MRLTSPYEYHAGASKDVPLENVSFLLEKPCPNGAQHTAAGMFMCIVLTMFMVSCTAVLAQPGH